jgi:hypothetical protein
VLAIGGHEVLPRQRLIGDDEDLPLRIRLSFDSQVLDRYWRTK